MNKFHTIWDNDSTDFNRKVTEFTNHNIIISHQFSSSISEGRKLFSVMFEYRPK